MYTRKHFEDLANEIAKNVDGLNRAYGKGDVRIQVMENFAKQLAYHFRMQNFRFDINAFLRACGMEGNEK